MLPEETMNRIMANAKILYKNLFGGDAIDDAPIHIDKELIYIENALLAEYNRSQKEIEELKEVIRKSLEDMKAGRFNTAFTNLTMKLS